MYLHMYVSQAALHAYQHLTDCKNCGTLDMHHQHNQLPPAAASCGCAVLKAYLCCQHVADNGQQPFKRLMPSIQLAVKLP
jgi:hypothetical protein